MKIWPTVLFLAFAACDEERPPAPTSEQSDQLNQAEALLNQMDEQVSQP
jgi:hypothetical protein